MMCLAQWPAATCRVSGCRDDQSEGAFDHCLQPNFGSPDLAQVDTWAPMLQWRFVVAALGRRVKGRVEPRVGLLDAGTDVERERSGVVVVPDCALIHEHSGASRVAR